MCACSARVLLSPPDAQCAGCHVAPPLIGSPLFLGILICFSSIDFLSVLIFSSSSAISLEGFFLSLSLLQVSAQQCQSHGQEHWAPHHLAWPHRGAVQGHHSHPMLWGRWPWTQPQRIGWPWAPSHSALPSLRFLSFQLRGNKTECDPQLRVPPQLHSRVRWKFLSI